MNAQTSCSPMARIKALLIGAHPALALFSYKMLSKIFHGRGPWWRNDDTIPRGPCRLIRGLAPLAKSYFDRRGRAKAAQNCDILRRIILQTDLVSCPNDRLAKL